MNNHTSKTKNFAVFSAVFLLAFASVAFASNITSEADYYKNPNELVGIVDVSANGTTYHLIRINGVESIVLKPEGQEFVQVKDEPTLNAIVSQYTSDHITDLVDQTRITTVNTDFDKAFGAWNYCGNTSMLLLKFYTPDLFKFVLAQATGALDIFTNKSGTTGNSIEMLSAEGKELNKTFFVAKQANAEIADPSLLSDAEALYTKLDLMKTQMETAKTHVSAYTTHYDKVYATAAQYLQRRPCNLTSAPIDTVINDLAFKDQLPRISTIVAQIKSKTDQRGDYAQIRKTIETKQADYNAITALRKAITTRFAALGLTLASVEGNIKTLDDSLAAIKNASTAAIAAEQEKKFNRAYNELRSELETLNKSTVLGDAENAINMTAGARESIQNASARLGAIPETDALKERYSVLKKGLDEKLGGLQQGGGNVTAADFQALQAEAMLLKKDADTVQPSWQKIDVTMIIGAVVVLALIGGGIMYYRKQKAQAERKVVPLQKQQ